MEMRIEFFLPRSPSSQHAYIYGMHTCLFPGCLSHCIEVDVLQCDVYCCFHHCTTYICFMYNCPIFMELICAFFNLFSLPSTYPHLSQSSPLKSLGNIHPPHTHAPVVSFSSWRRACPHRWLCVLRAAGRSPSGPPSRGISWPLSFGTACLHLLCLFPCCGGAFPPYCLRKGDKDSEAAQ